MNQARNKISAVSGVVALGSIDWVASTMNAVRGEGEREGGRGRERRRRVEGIIPKFFHAGDWRV